MPVRCIVFDLDDTLWECSPVIQQAEKKHYAWLSEYYPKITHKYSLDDFLQSRNQFMADNPELSHDLTRLRKRWLQSFADEFAYDDDLAESAFRIFWLARNDVVFYDGVLNILKDLSERFMLGVISNGNADVHHIGIGSLFEFVVSASEAGVAKPHPDIFHLALQKADMRPEDVVYVGDDPVRDIQGANQAGWHSIWYNPAKSKWQGNGQPSQIIHNFKQLADKIELL